ncbi:hypothetical protein G5V59_23985 [Nocardioides sp. W3-2-3]|nr:hypothetical protein [Nocardioides convexus]
MDRPLGALTRLAAALAALASLAASPPAVADDPGPTLAGTAVRGTPTAAHAPALATGRYLDRLPARGSLHYRLPRSATGSTFHVAVMFVGAGDSVGEGIRIQAGTTPGDQGCGSGGVFRPTLGEPAPVLFTNLTTWTDVSDHPCATARELHLTVGEPDESADAGREVEPAGLRGAAALRLRPRPAADPGAGAVDHAAPGGRAPAGAGRHHADERAGGERRQATR